MRTLFLRRDRFGGIATHARHAAEALLAIGVEVHVEDASAWIPNETDRVTNKLVSRRLQELSVGFDVIHAWGYRAAWACAEAFGGKRAWITTAHDFPSTLHPDLIDHLNLARRVLTTSEALRTVLDERWVLHTQCLLPCGQLAEPADRELARHKLQLDQDGVYILSAGRDLPSKGFQSLIDAMPRVQARYPATQVIITGSRPMGAGIFPGYVRDLTLWMSAADLIVVPSVKASTSMLALEAMALGVPVVLREAGGLPELVEERVSGFLFLNDDSLGDHLASLLQMPLTLESVGAAGRIRAELVHGTRRYAETLKSVYDAAVR